ncbi:HDOD domain-containing protein [Thiomicrorhabdus sp. ZW0627]|uniref:HDOD domain-containing protein n=1 Tax=Thiomicrorhabdus sp. ZW0627 TaxID=3039774 RepID=UPI0024370474|nr:HDOD domain-containing protein [Thiomicrorhabdus sp. ZW0627]MDG6773706.1 HDOD domain-containing protein [Thiomicrorhabdus sp. ZW0627]
MSFKDQIDVARQLLSRIEIPLLPKEVLGLQKLFNESEMPDPNKIKALVSANPFLAGELISLANLPTISRGNPITVRDIDSAIYRLGNKQLKNFILSIYVKKALDNNKIKGLSYHSQMIAIIAMTISRYNKFVTSDQAYLLGLMHDIGSFALSELDENYGNSFVGTLFEHYTSHKNEYSKYGTTHSALGYVIAGTWSIPPYIGQTILLHHEPRISAIKNDKLRSLVAIIELAHAIALRQNRRVQESAENIAIYKECQRILELTDDEMEIIHADAFKTA